jgi:hypothetical protein
MNQNKMKMVEERRYVNAAPKDGGVKFIDVNLEVDSVRITGVARRHKYVIVRYVRPRGSVAYIFFELYSDVGKDELTDVELLKRLVTLDSENEVRKKMIRELREFADKLEEQLRDLPVEIVVAATSNKSHGHVEVRLARQVDKDAFQRYVATCKALGMKFDSASRVWVYVPEWSQYVTATYCGSRGC